jgi:nucleolar protein 6
MEAHFAKVKPAAIRLMTDRVTGKPRGFGFLEFENFDRMETCLKKYQHSQFPDPTNKKLGHRKINVELTAGGGGNTEGRKEKIRSRNEKLAEERERDRLKREELEKKQKERKDKKDKFGRGKGKGEEETKAGEGDAHTAAESGMHPSRLAQLQQGPAPEFHGKRKRFGTYN